MERQRIEDGLDVLNKRIPEFVFLASALATIAVHEVEGSAMFRHEHLFTSC